MVVETYNGLVHMPYSVTLMWKWGCVSPGSNQRLEVTDPFVGGERRIVSIRMECWQVQFCSSKMVLLLLFVQVRLCGHVSLILHWHVAPLLHLNLLLTFLTRYLPLLLYSLLSFSTTKGRVFAIIISIFSTQISCSLQNIFISYY